MITLGTLIDKTHRYPVRVYYEDTDQQGVVFYANYLKFLERGRTEFLRHLGASPIEVESKFNCLFVVAHVDIHYHRPARLDDVLDVQTTLSTLGRVKLTMHQSIIRGQGLNQELISSATVSLAVVNHAGRPTRLPPEIQARFAQLL